MNNEEMKKRWKDLVELEHELFYEEHKGISTRSQCQSCGDGFCRRYACKDCIIKEIRDVIRGVKNLRRKPEGERT